jgi:S1-C subfamily serine protease
LLAVLGTGPIRAEFVRGNLYGVFSKYKRLVTLSEFRFEAPPQQVGEALIFCENGEIIGALNATLHRRESGVRFSPRAGSFATPDIVANDEIRSIGPSELTVAYTVGSDIVRQVVQGFRTPTHEVVFPSLGVQCVDIPGGGAYIKDIEADSAAARARLRRGDIIRDIGGEPTNNQIEFAKVMNRQQVGSKVLIRITRGPFVQLKEVIVGQAKRFDED